MSDIDSADLGQLRRDIRRLADSIEILTRAYCLVNGLDLVQLIEDWHAGEPTVREGAQVSA